MNYKARKKLLTKAVSKQKEAPLPILNPGVIRQLSFRKEMDRLRWVDFPSVEVVQNHIVKDEAEQKFRGYKVIYKNAPPIAVGSPSKIF